jgi:hypothetical protein
MVWTGQLARGRSGIANEAIANTVYCEVRVNCAKSLSTGEGVWNASFHGQTQGTQHYGADAAEDIALEWMQWNWVLRKLRGSKLSRIGLRPHQRLQLNLPFFLVPPSHTLDCK